MKKVLATLLYAFAATALAQQYAPGVYERELDGKIYEAIGQQDWARAQELAVTPRQKKMVSDAISAERDRRAQVSAANAARRPAVCTGQAGPYGSSTMICR